MSELGDPYFIGGPPEWAHEYDPGEDMTTTQNAKQPTIEQREEFARAVQELAEATDKVLNLWGQYFEDDAYTPETGYPYHESLDEVAANVSQWADGVSDDAHIAAGRA